jgi:hypothetical protein
MRLIWLIAMLLIGAALAQTAFKLVINGKSVSSGWITLNGKAYVQIEALQKAGVVVKKTGNTFSLTIPKPSAVVPKPSTPAPKPTPKPSEPVPKPAPKPSTPPVEVPVAPTNPILGINTTSSDIKVVVNNVNKPLLEGCANQTLNNGVWLMRLQNFAPLVRDGKAGYLITLEYSNISSIAVNLFETGFSDGEGGAGNFSLRLVNGTTLASSNTDSAFLYNNVQPNSKATVDIFFFTTESNLPSPQQFVVGQERRVNGFSVADPSLRFRLDCR